MLVYEKQTITPQGRRPLAARPLDLLYFIFFAAHIPATLLIDLQALYPASLTPAPLRALLKFYLQLSNDPLVGAVASPHLGWFRSFLSLELIFQLPVFVLGMRGLYRGSRTVYVLLLAYAASTATTTLPCIVYLLQTPPSAELLPVTRAQLVLLLSSYIPFFVIPLVMAVDMTMRLEALVRKGAEVEDADKWK